MQGKGSLASRSSHDWQHRKTHKPHRLVRFSSHLHLHGRLVSALHAAGRAPPMAEASSQLRRLHLRGECFALAGSLDCAAEAAAAPFTSELFADSVVFHLRLIQRVLVHAMGENLLQKSPISRGGSHLAGAGMVQRADVRGQRGGRRLMGLENAGRVSLL